MNNNIVTSEFEVLLVQKLNELNSFNDKKGTSEFIVPNDNSPLSNQLIKMELDRLENEKTPLYNIGDVLDITINSDDSIFSEYCVQIVDENTVPVEGMIYVNKESELGIALLNYIGEPISFIYNGMNLEVVVNKKIVPSK